MKLKLDAEGKVVVQDGKPVYVKDDGSEVAFDVAGTTATIARLNGEAKSHREAKEAAEAQLKNFSGIEDPKAALAALATIKNLDDKKLVDAGEVEKVRAEAIKAVEEKYSPYVKENETLKSQLNDHLIGGAFGSSKFIKESFAIEGEAGAAVARSLFGTSLKVEDGKIVGYDRNGQKLYSPSNPGELASPEESIKLLVEAYPHKNNILKGNGSSGSGAVTTTGQHQSSKQITRQQFDSMDPAARSQAMKDGATVTE